MHTDAVSSILLYINHYFYPIHYKYSHHSVYHNCHQCLHFICLNFLMFLYIKCGRKIIFREVLSPCTRLTINLLCRIISRTCRIKFSSHGLVSMVTQGNLSVIVTEPVLHCLQFFLPFQYVGLGGC